MGFIAAHLGIQVGLVVFCNLAGDGSRHIATNSGRQIPVYCVCHVFCSMVDQIFCLIGDSSIRSGIGDVFTRRISDILSISRSCFTGDSCYVFTLVGKCFSRNIGDIVRCIVGNILCRIGQGFCCCIADILSRAGHITGDRIRQITTNNIGHIFCSRIRNILGVVG